MKHFLEMGLIAGLMMCSLPSDCLKVINAEFDAGEGDSISDHIQVTCETPSGVRTSIAWVMNGWGLIGLNRMSMPYSIQYSPGKGRELACSKG